jgi:3-oxoacyl-[acyl-carrier protein] reductase
MRNVIVTGGSRGLGLGIAGKLAKEGYRAIAIARRSLAREVGKLGITVNAVAPGFVDTEMTRGMTDEQREKIVRRSALKRLAEVEDVANAVEFLLGPGAKSITGTVITVDAGNTA